VFVSSCMFVADVFSVLFIKHICHQAYCDVFIVSFVYLCCLFDNVVLLMLWYSAAAAAVPDQYAAWRINDHSMCRIWRILCGSRRLLWRRGNVVDC